MQLRMQCSVSLYVVRHSAFLCKLAFPFVMVVMKQRRHLCGPFHRDCDRWAAAGHVAFAGRVIGTNLVERIAHFLKYSPSHVKLVFAARHEVI